MSDSPNVTLLRDLVAERIDAAMDVFAREHPHLADAIERVKLIESTVHRLADDAEYQRAMEQAAADETLLDAAGQVVELVDRYVMKALGL